MIAQSATKTKEFLSPFRAGAKAPSPNFCGPYTHTSSENYFEMKSTWEAPYKFNGKELDSETGMYYYGARFFL